MMNLSPFLLKEQFVKGRTWALSVLNSLKSCSFFSSILRMSSRCKTKNTLNQAFQLSFFAFSNDGFFVGNLINQLIYISSIFMRNSTLMISSKDQWILSPPHHWISRTQGEFQEGSISARISLTSFECNY